MELTFYGGVNEIGRSAYYLEDGNRNIMLDCGIKLGEKTEYPLFDDRVARKINHIFISHAHLDHSGFVPHLFAKGFEPEVYATKPTRDLLGILLADYQRIQAEKTEKAFSQKHVNKLLQHMTIVEYDSVFHSDFDFTLHNSGHVLGGAMIRINHGGGVLYSGDINMRRSRILERCATGIPAETLILENTYGNKEDILPSIKDASQQLVESINETLMEGGIVLIPSFSIGKSQEILLILDDYMRSGALTQCKIYVDGMINKAMKVYRHNAIYANDELKRKILMSDYDPFKSTAFKKPKSKGREDVLEEPCVIISTSGMLSGGPALIYLEKMASDPKNKLIFVGYQAEGTRGSKILAGEKRIEIAGKEIELHLKIENIRMSGHADYNELIQFVRSVKGLKKIFLVHGEKSDLHDALVDKKYDVISPKLLETFRL